MGKEVMLTAIVLAKNEEKNIDDCLQSLSFCDEILLIDDFSTDATKKIAQSYAVKVLTHDLDGDFAAARNFALEYANGEWVFFVDADERVSKELQKEILIKIAQKEGIQGYQIIRFDFMKGKMLTHGETGNITLLRLAQKGKGTWKGHVHETWEIKGATAQLDAPLLHYPHQTIGEFLSEINFYTDLRAQELYKKRVQISFFSIIAYPLGKFVTNYLIKRGYMDGIEGMVMALMMSFHSFLVRGKLWQLWDQKSSH